MAETQIFYQAIGELYASLVVDEAGRKLLDTGENQYRAIVPGKVEKRYQGGKVYWRVYPKFQYGHLAFVIVSFSEKPKREPGRFYIQGDLVNSDEIKIWRNAETWNVHPKNWRPRLLLINWQDAPPADGAFWQLQAQLVDGKLEVTGASGPFPHPPRIENLAEFKYGGNKQEKEPSQQTEAQPKSQQTEAQPKSQQTDAQPKPNGTDVIINWEEMIPVSGKLELTIKINTLPQAQKVNGVCNFKVECDGRMIQIGLKQKQWTKLETANSTFANWIAAISGKMGTLTSNGFVLEDAQVQVFERKSKATTQPDVSLTEKSDLPSVTEQSGVTSEETTQIKQENDLAQAESVDAAAKSTALPEQKPAPKAKSSASGGEPQPKKIGKFKVQVR
jgi:hypothetical protein